MISDFMLKKITIYLIKGVVMKKALVLFLFCFTIISFVFPRDIFYITVYGTPEELKTAIAAGADVNARTRTEGGWTPLHLIIVMNNSPKVITVMTMLIEAGADVNARDEDGDTPLHLAAADNTNPDVVTALLEAGADLEAREVNDWTPLHAAASNNKNPAVITALVKAGANLEARDKDGWTPLHAAAIKNKNPDAVLVLLELGADPKARDAIGQTPWDYIQKNEALKNSEAYRALNDVQHE